MCHDNRHMRYETIQTLKDEDFKRSTGVSRAMFEKMLTVVKTGLRDFGRTPKLNRADQLLMMLMYWREYRTEFHIGLTYGVSEATVCRTIKKIENVLMKSGEFRLPGRKALQPSDTLIEVVLIDATEQPIERPKKSNGSITVVKRSGTPKKHN
jgi:Helix-turn-helix of DDE superfamily endonuclease